MKGGCPLPISEPQRARLRRLVEAHVQSVNAHELHAIMASFASHASLLLNGKLSGTPEAIAASYSRLGFSSEPGLFTGLKVIQEHEHFTDEQIVYEGRLHGEHTGTAPGFPPPTLTALDLPCVLMYRFDADDKLIAKHASIDFGPLFRGLYPAPAMPIPVASAPGVP